MFDIIMYIYILEFLLYLLYMFSLLFFDLSLLEIYLLLEIYHFNL